MSNSTLTATYSATSTIGLTPTATATPGPILAGPDVDNRNCALLGPFALAVQAAMGILVVGSLILKRHRERPKRPWKIWSLDVSKQMLGQAFVHSLNLVVSDQVAHHSKGNPCAAYFLNIAIDTTLGVFIIYLTLRFLTHIATDVWGLEGFVSGSYTGPVPPKEARARRRSANASIGSITTIGRHSRESTSSNRPYISHDASFASGLTGRPKMEYWFKQLGLYLLVILVMKIIVVLLVAIFPFLYSAGEGLLGLFGKHKHAQVVFSMALFPLIMNTVQFVLIDSLLRHNPNTSIYAPLPEEDEEVFGPNDDGPGRPDAAAARVSYDDASAGMAPHLLVGRSRSTSPRTASPKPRRNMLGAQRVSSTLSEHHVLGEDSADDADPVVRGNTRHPTTRASNVAADHAYPPSPRSSTGSAPTSPRSSSAQPDTAALRLSRA